MPLFSWTRAKARALIGIASAGGLTVLAGSGLYLVGGPAHASDYAPSAERIAALLADAHALQAPPAARPAALAAPMTAPIASPPQPAPFSSWPASPPSATSDAIASSGDLECLAAAVYYEARGETAEGQAAVAQVVINRTAHAHFPKTVCGVVYQHAGGHGCQFSFACNGATNRPREFAAWLRAKAIAARALAGYVMADIGGATSFHAARVGSGGTGAVRLGGHVFFAGQGGAARPMLLAKAARTTAPSPTIRYTFALGVLTPISPASRPQPTPDSSEPLQVIDATTLEPKPLPTAS